MNKFEEAFLEREAQKKITALKGLDFYIATDEDGAHTIGTLEQIKANIISDNYKIVSVFGKPYFMEIVAEEVFDKTCEEHTWVLKRCEVPGLCWIGEDLAQNDGVRYDSV